MKILIKENQFEKLISEQSWLRKLIGNSVDDLIANFGDDGVKAMESTLARGLSNEMNYLTRNGVVFVKSASGAEVELDAIKFLLKNIADKKHSVEEIIQYLPRKLADGTEFREIFKNGLKKVEQSASQNAGKVLTSIETKNLLKNCHSNRFCDVTNIVNNFFSKISNTAKLTTFDPSKVKVLSTSNVAGREVIETTLEDGTQILFYKSSGANVATTGKNAGEWFVIPGFADNGWFFKTQETINLTKGGNKYLTDMAKFLEQNGSKLLGQK